MRETFEKAANPALIAGLLLISQSASAQLLPGDAERGAVAHEQHCNGCHVQRFGDPATVYTRVNRRVNTVEGLIGQVAACNTMTGLGLDSDQLDNLVTYLEERHYRFEE